jgi:hypothetical protein
MRRGILGRLRWVAAVSVVGLLLPACGVWAGLGEKEEWASAIRAANDLVREQQGARVAISVSLEEIDTILREPADILFTRLEGSVAFSDTIYEPTARPDAAVLEAVESDENVGATLIFDDFALGLPRDLERGGLPWAFYDFDVEPEEGFDVEDRRLSVGFNPFSPAVLLQLMEGVLTGSVERSDRVAGEPGVEAFRGNFSNDAALMDLDEFRGDAIIRMFRAIGFGGEVFRGEVSLGQDGLPRRVEFLIEQRQDRLNLFELRITLELLDFGPQDDLDLPRAAQRMETERFSEMFLEFLRRA